MPSTAAGKAISSQNATTHGLTAVRLLVRPDEQVEFDQMVRGYHAEVKPQGAIENGIFDNLIHAAWNLRRLRRLETELFSLKADPLLDEAEAKNADRFQRYANQHQRNFYRALKELRTAQTHRLQKALAEPELVAAAPPLADAVELTKRTQIVSVPQAIQQLNSAIEGEAHILTAHARLKMSLDQARQ